MDRSELNYCAWLLIIITQILFVPAVNILKGNKYEKRLIAITGKSSRNPKPK
jgi:hypothetical protein